MQEFLEKLIRNNAGINSEQFVLRVYTCVYNIVLCIYIVHHHCSCIYIYSRCIYILHLYTCSYRNCVNSWKSVLSWFQFTTFLTLCRRRLFTGYSGMRTGGNTTGACCTVIYIIACVSGAHTYTYTFMHHAPSEFVGSPALCSTGCGGTGEAVMAMRLCSSSWASWAKAMKRRSSMAGHKREVKEEEEEEMKEKEERKFLW